jgi:hypothetical protein
VTNTTTTRAPSSVQCPQSFVNCERFGFGRCTLVKFLATRPKVGTSARAARLDVFLVTARLSCLEPSHNNGAHVSAQQRSFATDTPSSLRRAPLLRRRLLHLRLLAPRPALLSSKRIQTHFLEREDGPQHDGQQHEARDRNGDAGGGRASPGVPLPAQLTAFFIYLVAVVAVGVSLNPENHSKKTIPTSMRVPGSC